MEKLQTVQELFGRMIGELTAGAWPAFLKTAAWTFKYSFPDQLLIYAQRPDAKACASIDVWNKRLNRTVKADAAHIALIDDHGDDIRLHYVVDVADTEGPGRVPLWHLTERNRDYVYTALAAGFGVSLDSAEDKTAFFENIARAMVDRAMPQASFSLQRVQPSCNGLRDMTPAEAEASLRELLIASVTAAMMYRCELTPNFPEGEMSPFRNIGAFSDPRALSILGQTSQALSREALMVAAKAAQDYNKTHKEEIEYEYSVSESRGVQNSRSDNNINRASEPVRENAQELPADTTAERVHRDAADRPLTGAPEGDRGSSAGDVRPGDGSAAEGEPGAEQSAGRESLDNAHGESANESGHAGSGGADLHLTPESLPEAREYGIDVNFPSTAEQAAVVASVQGLLHIPQEEIDQVLTGDFAQKVNIGTIRTFFASNPGSEEATAFLKEHYAELDDSMILPDGRYVAVQALESGLHLTSDDARGLVSWETVASRIRGLIADGRYPAPVAAPEKVPADSNALAEGDTFTLGGVQYLVTGINQESLILQDIEHPIFTTPMARSVLDLLLKNEARIAVAPLTVSEPERPEPSMEPQITAQAPEEVPVPEEESRNDPAAPAAQEAFQERSESLTKRNYRFLEHYAPEIMDGTLDYMRFESETYEPLYIERIAPDVIAIAHTFVQMGDVMYDPEMVFAVLDDSKELLPLSFEQSNPGVYQRVYRDEEDPNSKNVTLEQDLNSFFRTWSQNLLWQEHQPVRGIKHRASGDLEYTFGENRELQLKETPQNEAPQEHASEAPTLSTGLTMRNGLYVGDVVSFDHDEFVVTSIHGNIADTLFLRDGSTGVPMEVDQILAQVQGGGTTRLTHFWERPGYQPSRPDQQVLAELLNHFEKWRTSDGVYVPGELYQVAMERMSHYYVSDSPAYNQDAIRDVATEIRRWFPKHDPVTTRASETERVLSEAAERLRIASGITSSFEDIGNIVRLQQWRDGDELRLRNDLSNLLHGSQRIYPEKLAKFPQGYYYRASDEAAQIVTMAKYLETHEPDFAVLSPAQISLYKSSLASAQRYMNDLPALYIAPEGRQEPQSLFAGDILTIEGVRWEVYEITNDRAILTSMETGEATNFPVDALLQAVRTEPETLLQHFWERTEGLENLPVPEDPALEQEEVPAPSLIHVGDFYEDAYGKGVVTQVFPEQYEGKHEAAFSYVDPDAAPGSRASKGYVMHTKSAEARIRNGEATLIPAAERDVEPVQEEKELTLFDFVYEQEHKDAPAPVSVNSSPNASGRINFRVPAEAENYGGPKARYRNNVAAIRLLKQLEAEDRLATAEEQQTLAKYVGWGGIPQAFDPNNAQWASEYKELKELLTEKEHASAQESTLTAFYTPPAVTEAIYTALDKFGFRRGNILDPCCGTGNFFGMLPPSMQGSKLYGVELDDISGRISRQLYQNANILIEGYEKTKLPDSFYDVAVGNVPFGQFKLPDRRYDKENFLIHDYFFAKTLDKVRPGGIVAFVTSTGTMDKTNDSVRRYIAQRADLLGAIRLPNSTFKENAGTDVASDILFLKKRSRPMVQEPDWLGLGHSYNYEKQTWGPVINQYFVDNPEMVLGDIVEVSGPHGPEVTCVAREGEDLRTALQEAVSNLTGYIDLSIDDLEEEEDRKSIPADPSVRNFSYTLVDGDIYFREDSLMHPVETNNTAQQRIKGMIGLRDLTHKLIDAQVQDAPDEEVFALQQQLNDAYDAFTEKHGILNSRANSNAFSDDSAYFLLCSLEHVDDDGNFLGKADMFYKRTIGRHVAVSHTDTAQEALAVCMGERGKVDLGFISSLCGRTQEDALEELKGLVFPVPGREGEYEISSIYLSGNVRQKLLEAQEAAKEDPKFAVNAEYLEAALPEPLTPEEISVRLGATWIPQEDVTAFIQELLEFDDNSYVRYYKDRITAVYEPALDNWAITNKNWDNRTIVTSTYGTDRAPAYRLIEDALNQKNTQLFDLKVGEDGKERRVLNVEETLAARDKQELIKEKFKEWIWSDPERTERLSKLYNEKFNSMVPPTYDAGMVVFHGMNPYIKLEQHQKESIARILYGGNTQLAHNVGAGKTWTMAAAAMEGKYLGLCNKSLIVVPNHLVGQWASAIYDLYPAANVLASTKKDFETKNRKKFCSRIATGDYDIVVIGHSQFERIPLSVERQEATLREQISDITNSISEMRSNRTESFTIKQMERMKKQLTAKLEKLQDGKKRDDVVSFEELGVDRLFVDESHEYKNLFLYTKMHNVAGISQTDSQKASDLFMKCRYMDELTGNKGNIHATGTPLSNTMAELYTTQRYLQYDLLQEMGLGSFDAWASTFGETVQSIELAPEGQGYRERTRFANFFNLPELIAIYKQTADVRPADVLNLPVPDVEYHTDVVPASEEQREEVEKLSERADAIRQRRVNNKEDNMLCITNDGRKLALDQRLLNPELPDNPNSKVNACVKNIMKYYREGEEEKLTQLVFCDLSTPTGTGFNVYQDLKNKLVAQGIPADEIRFIHEANSDAQKEALFAKVRSGAVRVLMGSTSKMGTGTNVQDRLIAGHDLDCPWRPSDLEQRAGRVIRRGNQNKKVHIHRYVTENTFDAYLYQLIESKQRFASQIFTSKSPVRAAADVDESVLNYSQIKALASGNPKVREKIELEIEVARLKAVENNYKRDQRYLAFRLQTIPDDLAKSKERLQGLEEDNALIVASPSRGEKGELLPVEVQGVTHETQGDAGKAIFDAMKHLPEKDKWFCIGHLRGFRILAQKKDQGQPQLALAGKRSYAINYGDDPVGLMVRMNNVLDNGISKSIAGCRKDIEQYTNELQSTKEAYGKPFHSAQSLKEKQARLQQLEKELSLDKLAEGQTHEEMDTAAPEVPRSNSLHERVANAAQRHEAQLSASSSGRTPHDHLR